MITLGLSAIMKNESHVILRNLDSIKPIIDHVTLVDTGSTDNTIEVVKKWGVDNNIPVDVYERPFDNFENSRNYAREMALGKTDYCMWIDADEVLKIDDDFDKESIGEKEFWMLQTYLGANRYSRNEIWKNDDRFVWYGPVHEFIKVKDPNVKVTTGMLEGLKVIVYNEGGSWKDDPSKKYYKQALMLEEYILDNNDPRWVFYLAQSYNDSATTGNWILDKDRLTKAAYYYKKRAQHHEGYPEEIYMAQLCYSNCQLRLEEPWSKVHQEYLKTWKMEPRRADPLIAISEFYLKTDNFLPAYLYSKHMYDNFLDRYPKELLFYVEEQLYVYKIPRIHLDICVSMGKAKECSEILDKMFLLSKKYPYIYDQNKVNEIYDKRKQLDVMIKKGMKEPEFFNPLAHNTTK